MGSPGLASPGGKGEALTPTRVASAVKLWEKNLELREAEEEGSLSPKGEGPLTMALRPPSTPRASLGGSNLPQPGSTPSSLATYARRKSAIPLTPSAPSTATTSADDLAALQEALRHRDPRNDSPALGAGGSDSPTPPAAPGERSLGRRKPSMLAMRGSLSRPTTPSNPTRPPMPGQMEIGDAVKIEVAGVAMQGVLRFLGEVEGKEGNWGGVELDKQWEGKGKNDGSVKGTQYFACLPNCGLFLPLSKITVLKRPPSRIAATATTPKPPARNPPSLTAGSRASKYAKLTASDLASGSTASPSTPKAPGPPSSPTKRAPTTPVASRTPLSPSASSTTTPKPRPRASLAGSFATPRAGTTTRAIPTPRKSIGGIGTPAVTPRRPPSSLRNHAVPPLPSSASGTATTPSARRMSMASSTTRETERSMTPSSALGRSSRQSFASESSTSAASEVMGRRSVLGRSTPVRSYSRQSEVSTRSFMGDSTGGAGEVKEAREREREVRELLEASEKVGREVEERLAGKEQEVKELKKKLRETQEGWEREKEERENLEAEREAEKLRIAAEKVGLGEGEKAKEDLVAEMEAKLAEAMQREVANKSLVERTTREWDNKFAAKEGEIESLRERLAEAVELRDELNLEVDKLKGYGRTLCDEYEARIAEIEEARLEAVEQLEASLERQFKSGLERDDGVESPTSSSPSARLSNSLGSSHTSAADVINAETAIAEAEHLRTKVDALEVMLADAKDHLAAEIEDAKRRRQKTAEAEQVLKKEVKSLKEALERSTKVEARLTARVEELEEALLESQVALEEERSELEGLRHDAGGPDAGVADDLKRANKELVKLRTERDEARRDLTRNSELISELRDDLKTAERELDRYHQAKANGSSTPVQQQPTQDTSNGIATSPTLARRDSLQSVGSRRSIGGKDEATASKELMGLKILYSTLQEENRDLAQKNKTLLEETQGLRDGQRALEVTVENLMNQLDSDGHAPTSASVERRESTQLAQREADELRAKLLDVEAKAAKDVAKWKREVDELERLVESKILDEGDLRDQLEHYKSIAGATKSSSREPSTSEPVSAKVTEGDACDMCGELGHQVDTCPIFGDSASSTSSKMAKTSSASSGEFCDDCEEYGHSLEDCPLANEIF
ncbi:CAP-Gly domain-containing protein [Pseudohyphozyma bogoriensis]|nr:CAP-Gly domain-containing protein [Pseudohyphozyma bogoriensis]